MWTYHQSSGELDHAGSVVAYGWSGFEDGINVPAMQDIRMVGPIPRGLWVLADPPIDSPQLGPFALRLTPALDTDTCGRNSFYIHGRSFSKPFDSSEGCVVFDQSAREKIWQSGDREFMVVA